MQRKLEQPPRCLHPSLQPSHKMQAPLTYARDTHGRINGVTSSQAGEGWTYGYDDLDRLTGATNTTDSLLTQSFGYDRVGNMTSNSAIGTYGYPATGSPRPHTVTSTPLGSYGYDANGNMTSAAG